MEIKFYRSIGDKVWFMNENHTAEGTISAVRYSKSVSCVNYETVSENEIYSVDIDGRRIGDNYRTCQLFDTKEDLLKSL